MDSIVFRKEYIEPKTPYNIMSVCVFQMKKSYKNSYAYISGLKSTIDNLSRVLPGFYLRVYYDNSIAKSPKWMKVIEYARKKTKVQLVKFEHPWFMDSDGYHFGTFGTIVRLFPVFSNDEPNLRTILVGDVDYNENMFPYWKTTYKVFNESKSQVHMYERRCSHLSERVKKVVQLLNVPFSPYLNSLFTKIRFPKTMLDTFLKCMHDGKNVNATLGCKEIDVFINKTDHSKVRQINKMEAQKFMYGIDEICLLMMLKYVIDSKIIYSYHAFPDISLPFRYTDDVNTINTSEHEYLLKRIMLKHYNTDLSPAENYKKLNDILHIQYNTYFNPKAPKGDTKLMAYFSRNAIALFKELSEKDYAKYKLRQDIVKCVSSNNLSMNGMTLIVVNPNKTKSVNKKTNKS